MISFKIATPEKIVYEDVIHQISIPTIGGEITILPNHIPLVTVLQSGELRFSDKEGEHAYAVWGGFVEVGNNSITVLTDNAERADEIDLQRAEEARKRAEQEVIDAKNRQDIDFAKLQSILDREINRVRVGRKYRKQ